MHSEGKLLISEQIQTAWNFITSEKTTVDIIYLKHILTYQCVKIHAANPKNILFLTIKSKQLLLFGCYLAIFKLNSSRDALATLDIYCIKIVFYKFEIHALSAALINRGIIMKKSCYEEEIRQKVVFQIRQNTIYYTNRVSLVLINGENTIFVRF